MTEQLRIISSILFNLAHLVADVHYICNSKLYFIINPESHYYSVVMVVLEDKG